VKNNGQNKVVFDLELGRRCEKGCTCNSMYVGRNCRVSLFTFVQDLLQHRILLNLPFNKHLPQHQSSCISTECIFLEDLQTKPVTHYYFSSNYSIKSQLWDQQQQRVRSQRSFLPLPWQLCMVLDGEAVKTHTPATRRSQWKNTCTS